MPDSEPADFGAIPQSWDEFDRYARPRLLARWDFAAKQGIDVDAAVQEGLLATHIEFPVLAPWALMLAFSRTAGLYEMGDAFRAKTRRHERPHDPATLPAVALAVDGHERQIIDRALVGAVLPQLSDSDQELLELDMLGFGADEIAGILGIYPNAVRQRLYRARKRFRALAGEDARSVVPLLLAEVRRDPAGTAASAVPFALAARAAFTAAVSVGALLVPGSPEPPRPAPPTNALAPSDGTDFAVPEGTRRVAVRAPGRPGSSAPGRVGALPPRSRPSRGTLRPALTARVGAACVGTALCIAPKDEEPPKEGDRVTPGGEDGPVYITQSLVPCDALPSHPLVTCEDGSKPSGEQESGAARVKDSGPYPVSPGAAP